MQDSMKMCKWEKKGGKGRFYSPAWFLPGKLTDGIMAVFGEVAVLLLPGLGFAAGRR